MDKVAYLINDISEFGKFVAFCIEKDISVWRNYWNQREAGTHCYTIDWKNRACQHSSERFYREEGYKIVVPEFRVDAYGNWMITN